MLPLSVAGTWLGPTSQVWLPRLWTLLLSTAADMVVLHVLSRLRVQRPWFVLAVLSASTWTGVVMASRTFSNTLEGIWLVLLIGVFVEVVFVSFQWPGASPWLLQVCAGALLALGIWTRFTFALFAAPIGVAMVALAVLRPMMGVETLHEGEDVSEAVRPEEHLRHRKRLRSPEPASEPLRRGTDNTNAVLWSVLEAAAHAGGGFFVTAAALIAWDTAWFRSEKWVLAPWENMVYNMDPSNLAKHGTHPRWLHALVNAPMLFGPVYLVALAACWSRVREAREQGLRTPEAWVNTALVGVMGLSMLGLSWAPHQEARFLVPLALPLGLLALPTLQSPSRVWLPLRILWVLWIVGGIAWFGFLHQGGVFSSLANLPTAEAHPVVIASHGALFLPRSLARIPTTVAHPLDIHLCEQKGETTDRFLPQAVPVQWFEDGERGIDAAAAELSKACGDGGGSLILLTAASVTQESIARVARAVPTSTWKPLRSSWPHISMEVPLSSEWTLDTTLFQCAPTRRQ
jgi:GPI mannosyltransferase 4